MYQSGRTVCSIVRSHGLQGKVGTALLCFSYLVREEAKSVDAAPQRVAAVYDKYGRALQASGDLNKSDPACSRLISRAATSPSLLSGDAISLGRLCLSDAR
jgi:hypothetical protein